MGRENTLSCAASAPAGPHGIDLVGRFSASFEVEDATEDYLIWEVIITPPEGDQLEYSGMELTSDSGKAKYQWSTNVMLNKVGLWKIFAKCECGKDRWHKQHSSTSTVTVVKYEA